MNKTLKEIIILVLTAAITYTILMFTIQTYIVYGPSMQPAYVENQRLIVNKVVYKLHEPQRGDIIVFKPPFQETVNYIKRVIAFPGESVEVKNGKVYVYKTDGSTLILEEPYISAQPAGTSAKRTVPEGQYYVMGDNRNNSNDSRNGWTVPRENIIGKAWITIWPPSRWGMPHHYEFADTILPVMAGLRPVHEQ